MAEGPTFSEKVPLGVSLPWEDILSIHSVTLSQVLPHVGQNSCVIEGHFRRAVQIVPGDLGGIIGCGRLDATGIDAAEKDHTDSPTTGVAAGITEDGQLL